MTFLELADLRRSVRAYGGDPVPEEALKRCLEAARLAPSACNSQPWSFVAVREPALRTQVAHALLLPPSRMNRFAEQAPVLIVVVAEKPSLSAGIGASFKRLPYWLMDVGMAAEHFCLQAAEEGFGTCMMGWFDERRLRRLLELPRDRKIALVISVGRPAEDGDVPPKSRKPLERIAFREKYGIKL